MIKTVTLDPHTTVDGVQKQSGENLHLSPEKTREFAFLENQGLKGRISAPVYDGFQILML
ncbi:MAG: hypothetical protein JXR23_05230 [Pontiellaceae bacterium]|nr:hypothetical protein [Pontiellaceae bacterium]